MKKIILTLFLLALSTSCFAFIDINKGIWKFKEQIEKCDKSVIPLIEEDLKDFNPDDNDWEKWLGRLAGIKRYMSHECIYFEIPENGYSIFNYYLAKKNAQVVDFLLTNFEHYDQELSFIEDAIETKDAAMIEVALKYHTRQNNFTIHVAEPLSEKFSTAENDAVREGIAKYCCKALETFDPINLATDFILNNMDLIQFAAEHKFLDGNMKLTGTPVIIHLSDGSCFRKIAYEQRIKLIKLFLDAGADINATNKNNCTALIYSIESDFSQIFQLLLEQGADVTIADRYSATPLYYAISYGNITAAEQLIKTGKALDILSSNGTSALWNAIDKKLYDIAEKLIAAGADVNIHEGNNKTPLYKAWYQGNYDLFKLLIEKGADVNVKDSKGKTIIFHTIWSSNSKFTELLIENGADINQHANNGDTPLIDMCKQEYENPSYIASILKFNPDINAVNNDGESALFYAFEKPEIVKFLLENGANKKLKNKNGKTAYDICLEQYKENKDPYYKKTLNLLKK